MNNKSIVSNLSINKPKFLLFIIHYYLLFYYIN